MTMSSSRWKDRTCLLKLDSIQPTARRFIVYIPTIHTLYTHSLSRSIRSVCTRYPQEITVNDSSRWSLETRLDSTHGLQIHRSMASYLDSYRLLNKVSQVEAKDSSCYTPIPCSACQDHIETDPLVWLWCGRGVRCWGTQQWWMYTLCNKWRPQLYLSWKSSSKKYMPKSMKEMTEQTRHWLLPDNTTLLPTWSHMAA